MKMAKQSLLIDEGGADVDTELRVNEEYAARLQHNKEREAWHRLKEKNPRLAARIEASSAVTAAEGEDEEGADADESTSEDDDEEEAQLADQEEQRRFLSVLSRIKARDAAIYRPDTQLYPGGEKDDEDENGEGGDGEGQPRRGRQQRPARLRDVLARQAIEGEAGSSDDKEDAETGARAAGPSYVEEQEQLRQAFLQEVEEAKAGEQDEDAFGGILRAKRRILPDASEAAAGAGGGDGGEGTQALLDAYFGADEALPADERFLKAYISQQGWIDKSDRADGLLGDDIEEDEEHLAAAERFEAQYNHRFEEPGAANMITYPRTLEGTVRKADDRRRLQREARAARKAQEAAQHAAEIKRLKSHKRREMDERLARIREVSGSAAAERMLAQVLGSADLDLDAYDQAMEAAFGDSYYQDQDEELGDPDPEAGSDDDAAEPALPPVPEIEDMPAADDAPGPPEVNGDEAAAAGEEGGRAELERLVADYHGLDAQDYVGGVACRFRYREVPAASYGLSIAEVLGLPDRELNQVVGLRRLAPYRDDGGVARPNYGKLRELQAASQQPLRKKRKADKAAGASLWVEREAPAAKRRTAGDAAPSRKGSEEQLQQGAEEAAKAPKKAKIAARHEDRQPEMAASASAPDGVKAGAVAGDDDRKAAAAAAQKAQSRLASYARPTLSKPDAKGMAGNKKKKSSTGTPSQAAAVEAAEQQLTKSQRKNLWRQRRREAMRSMMPS